jgi:hypothetical protein
MPYTSGQAAYKLAFEVSPITFVGGIASNFPGGALPLLAITQAADFQGLLSGGSLDLDNCFAYFRPLPGTSMADNQIGNFPFANQTIAANAIVTQPLVCSLLMYCPCRDTNDYALKFAIMTSLKAAIAQHDTAEGMYAVSTPSGIYSNVILRSLSDVSGGESNQCQMAWKWDFSQPLVTLQAGAPSMTNASMSALVNMVQSDGSLTGVGQTVGNAQTIAAPQISPVAGATLSTSIPNVTTPLAA